MVLPLSTIPGYAARQSTSENSSLSFHFEDVYSVCSLGDMLEE